MSSRLYLAALFLACLFATPSLASSGTKYFAGHQPNLEALQQAQAAAAADGKLLMIVLGADWCHDSRALMEHFSKAEFSVQLQQRFVVRPYNVGYLETGFAVTQAYGQPTYYGTPTVMIIEPNSGKVLNKTDWQHWTNAASHSAEAFTKYFLNGSFDQPKPHVATPKTTWQIRVQQFETTQAQRVRAGFQAVSPLLRAYMESDAKQPSEEFKALWSELAEFRNQVFDASVKLYKQTEASDLPKFSPRSWEESEQE